MTPNFCKWKINVFPVLFSPSIIWLIKNISSRPTMMRILILLRIAIGIFSSFENMHGGGPRPKHRQRNLYNRLPNKTDILPMISMKRNTKVSNLQVCLAHNLFLSGCPLANASLPFWSEDKEWMHSGFSSLWQVCCPHPFFLLKTGCSRFGLYHRCFLGGSLLQHRFHLLCH